MRSVDMKPMPRVYAPARLLGTLLRVPDRAEGGDPALLEAMDDVPGERLVRDADHGVRAGGDVGPVGETEHVRPSEFVGVPDDRFGLGGEDLVDERGPIG